IEPPGFWLSILRNRRHLPAPMRVTSTNGVLPIKSSTCCAGTKRSPGAKSMDGCRRRTSGAEKCCGQGRMKPPRKFNPDQQGAGMQNPCRVVENARVPYGPARRMPRMRFQEQNSYHEDTFVLRTK